MSGKIPVETSGDPRRIAWQLQLQILYAANIRNLERFHERKREFN
jgi:hypothetical protein